MNRPVLCVYAHPDDESFGVAGTIAKMSEERDVYLVCATDGNDPSSKDDLTEVRKKELLKAADVLGIKKVIFLGYPDGSLNNQIYHELAEKIGDLVDSLDPEILMTFEPRGISGHLDHVAVSMVTNYVFEKKEQVSELWMNCLNKQVYPKRDDYFIYFPEGYSMDEIDRVVDIETYIEKKIAALRAHASQFKDVDRHIQRIRDDAREYFLVRRRE